MSGIKETHSWYNAPYILYSKFTYILLETERLHLICMHFFNRMKTYTLTQVWILIVCMMYGNCVHKFLLVVEGYVCVIYCLCINVLYVISIQIINFSCLILRCWSVYVDIFIIYPNLVLLYWATSRLYHMIHSCCTHLFNTPAGYN